MLELVMQTKNNESDLNEYKSFIVVDYDDDYFYTDNFLIVDKNTLNVVSPVTYKGAKVEKKSEEHDIANKKAELLTKIINFQSIDGLLFAEEINNLNIYELYQLEDNLKSMKSILKLKLTQQ